MPHPPYFEVKLADGKSMVAYGAPESYVQGCLTGTRATVHEVDAGRAAQINNYCGANDWAGQTHIRMRALEALVDVLTKPNLGKDPI